MFTEAQKIRLDMLLDGLVKADTKEERQEIRLDVALLIASIKMGICAY